MTEATQNPAARYAQALALEKSAWQALQQHEPGSPERARAWAAWSEAISRTNRAWRQLSSQSLSSKRAPRSDASAPLRDRALGSPPRLHP